MSRRLPVCAVCGEPLGNSLTLRITWEKVKGRPEVGWHDECTEGDPLFKQLFQNDDPNWENDLVPSLNEIDGRGPGRLVVNKGWKR